ncbi:MAG: hypothetical protein ABFD75_15665 [Smithella sp.]
MSDEKMLKEDTSGGYDGGSKRSVRSNVFLIRDQKMQQSLHEKNIRLYNPREEDVWYALADDVILNSGFFYGKDRKMQKNESIQQKDSIHVQAAGSVRIYM